MVKHSNKTETSNLKAAAPLLWRTAAFLCICILYSGIVGPRIINNGLVGKDGFQIYGGAGKALLFAVVALFLLLQRRGFEISLNKWKPLSLVWFAISIACIIGAWVSIGKLLSGQQGLGLIILTHVLLLSSLLFVLGGTFGSANIRLLAKMYKKELLVAAFLAAVFYGYLYLVYGLWQVLAAVVLNAVTWLLRLSGLYAVVLSRNVLMLDKFTIEISKYCSGIDSIALFSGLYLVVGIIDWQRFNKRRFLVIFAPALVVLFSFNILRVYVLIMAGYYINPHIAFSLFHTYAGMVFFIIYTAIFWRVSYGWLLTKAKHSI